MLIFVACAFVAALSVFVLFVVRAGTPGIAIILFGGAIFFPIFLWDAIRHMRQGGEFRSWLSAERIGQVVPFQEMGTSFEVSLEDIASLRRIEPLSDNGTTRYVIETNEGNAHELCIYYGNPVDRYFAQIQKLRPKVEFSKVEN